MMDTGYLNLRRLAIEGSAAQFGLDYIDVRQSPQPGQKSDSILVVNFITGQAPLSGLLAALSPANIEIRNSNGQRVPDFSIKSIAVESNTVRLVLLSSSVAYTQYALGFIGITGLDPFFSSAPFVVEAEDQFDPAPVQQAAPEPLPDANVNYLARDSVSFMREMFGRLAQTLPEWTERNPADVGVTLVEALAQAADELAYFQDAVATEAYPGLARQRVSLRRHARLLGYPLSEGANSRVFVHVEVTSNLKLPANLQLLSRTAPAVRLAPNSPEYFEALNLNPIVYETVAPLDAAVALNRLQIYDWGAPDFILAVGSVSCACAGHIPELQPGALLIFEELLSPQSGLASEARSDHRQCVRVQSVTLTEDPLGGQFLNPPVAGPVDITQVVWVPEDALTFDLVVSTVIGETPVKNVSGATGNILVADSGRTCFETLVMPDQGLTTTLSTPGLVFATPWSDVPGAPATGLLDQTPQGSVPAAVLVSPDGASWRPAPDLLSCRHYDRNFVVEMENDRSAQLRFGDGVHGRRPAVGTAFATTYRVCTTPSHTGIDALYHVVSDSTGVVGVRNPLSSVDGPGPEASVDVPIFVPEIIKSQRRLVTGDDYIAIAKTYPNVRAAVAVLRWNGSWYTAYVSVLLEGDQPVTVDFLGGLATFLNRYRLMGRDLEVRAPEYVPLEICLVVYVNPDRFQSTVQQALLEAFSNRLLPNGQRGFFYAANFTFNQNVYLSAVLDVATRTPGVAYIDLKDPDSRFQRLGSARDNVLDGVISIGALEVARLDNNREEPQFGSITFVMRGGQ